MAAGLVPIAPPAPRRDHPVEINRRLVEEVRARFPQDGGEIERIVKDLAELSPSYSTTRPTASQPGGAGCCTPIPDLPGSVSDAIGTDWIRALDELS